VIPTPRPPSNPDCAPAVVLYGPGREAIVLHPGGAEHENAVAARARLERRGFAVVEVPADLAPFLRGVPQLERAQILELVAGLAGEAVA
jgi:hypothetical protein